MKYEVLSFTLHWLGRGVTVRLSHCDRGLAMLFPNATPPRASSIVATVAVCTSPGLEAPLTDHVSCVWPLA